MVTSSGDWRTSILFYFLFLGGFSFSVFVFKRGSLFISSSLVVFFLLLLLKKGVPFFTAVENFVASFWPTFRPSQARYLSGLYVTGALSNDEVVRGSAFGKPGVRSFFCALHTRKKETTKTRRRKKNRRKTKREKKKREEKRKIKTN